MTPFSSRLLSHLRFRAAAYVVLLVALVPTLVAFWRLREITRARDEMRFQAVAAEVEETVRGSFEKLTGDLEMFSGFFAASYSVSKAEWKAFVTKLNLGQRHPGLRSVGFAHQLEREQVPQFEQQLRALGETNFAVRPAVAQPLSFPTVFFTRFPSLDAAGVGWDSYSDADRRAALHTALRTGRAAITKKLSFWRDGVREEEGFVLFLPTRTGGASGEANQWQGAMFSAFVPQHFFNALPENKFDGQAAVEVFDGVAPEPAARVGSFAKNAEEGVPRFTVDRLVHFLGHPFLLRVSARPQFAAHSDKYLPTAVLACGLGFSFLLFAIAWSQGGARLAADRLNRRLAESEERLRAANAELEGKISEAKITEGLLAYERDLLRMLLEHSPDPIYFKDVEGRFIKCGRAIAPHLGIAMANEAMGRTDFDFFAEDHARPAFECEQEIIRTGRPVIGLVEKETWRDGRETWVLTSKMPLRDKSGAIIGTFGITKDISKLKQAERELEKEKEMLAVTLRSIGDGVITTDVQGRIVLFNRVAEQLTGSTADRAVGRPLEEVFQIRALGDKPSNGQCLERTLNGEAPPPERDVVSATSPDPSPPSLITTGASSARCWSSATSRSGSRPRPSCKRPPSSNPSACSRAGSRMISTTP
jgi:PAS domain S-box-containing protein